MPRSAIWTMVSGCGLLLAAAPAGADDAAAPASEIQRIVLFAPGGPLLLGVVIDTGSKSITEQRADYANELFGRLDVDHSGGLDSQEWAQIPVIGSIQNGNAPIAAPEQYAVEGVLRPDGLLALVNAQLGPQFTIVAKQRLVQTVRLVDLLDRDGDGVISLVEVAQASRAMHRNDLDDDEMLSVAELQPYPSSILQAQRQARAEDARTALAVQVSNAQEIDGAVARIASSFTAAGADGVELIQCGFGKSAARFDADHDGRLNRGELREWIARGDVDLRLDVNMPERGLPRVAAESNARSSRLEPAKPESLRSWSAVLDGAGFRADVMNNRRMADFSVSFAKTRFRVSDADGNGYLDAQEFAGLQYSAPFAVVDLNADGMLKMEELEQFARTQAQLAQTQLVLTLTDEIATLFQLIDADGNRFLSPRELASVEERLRPMDRNGDGKFDQQDFVSDFKLSFSFAVPSNLRETSRQAPEMAATGRKLPLSRIGPTWFQKMDRNRDRDVSWREFLGPRSAFEALDANHDGLIDKDEADAAPDEPGSPDAGS